MKVSASARHALEHLLALANAGVEGYRHAAAAVDDPATQALLADCAVRRGDVVMALTQMLSGLGVEPEIHGSLPASIHRGWVDVLAATRAHPTDAVLRECERGEAEALVAFRKVFAFDFPPPIAEVLLQQLRRVRDVADRLHDFRTGAPPESGPARSNSNG